MFIPFEIEIEEDVAFRCRHAGVVYTLIAACIGVHLWLYAHVSEAVRLDAMYTFGAVRFQFRWWSAITCTFLHGSLLHLLGNLYFLWIYGRSVERCLGHARFTVLYLAGSVISVSVHLLTVSAFYADEPTIGASGAISAVLGAFLVFWPRARLRCLLFTLVSFRPLVVQAPAYIVLGLWFAGQLVYSLKLVGDISNIAFWAHVAGFAAGAGSATFFQRRDRRMAAAVQRRFRQPLLDAWSAVAAHDAPRATACCNAVNDAVVEDMAGTCELVRGLAHLQDGGGRKATAHLLRALCQARDYRNDRALLTAYLQLRKYLPAAEIPADVHRDAGFAAMALRLPAPALGAFRQALECGFDGNPDAMLRAVEGLLRRGARQTPDAGGGAGCSSHLRGGGRLA